MKNNSTWPLNIILAKDCYFSIFLVIFLSLSLICCLKGAGQKGITIAGSTSIQPFADQWAEVFMKANPGKVVNVQGGGSSAGIQAVLTRAAQIGMSSRELKPEEKSLTEFVVAWDGLAIIVHPANPLNNLSLEAVQKIFSGEIKSWQEVGGPDQLIHVVTREEGSGTRGAFQEMVMKGHRISPRAIVQDSNGTVREVVANDPYAIGYLSLGLVDERVKAISLDGVEPSLEQLTLRKYRLLRPFLLVTAGQPEGLAQEFLSFILSREGQKLIAQQGLIPAEIVSQVPTSENKGNRWSP